MVTTPPATTNAAADKPFTALDERLTPAVRAWLGTALAEAAEAAAPAGHRRGLPAWELRFAEAGRRCGSETAADTARVLLLHTAGANAATAARLYRRGTADERRAVLLALPGLELAPEEGLPLVEDALRTSDTRLIAAAVGSYAAEHLAPHAWRHAVLKCLCTGVPAAAVAGLARRARGDAELARMLADHTGECTAASRPIPVDLYLVQALTAEAEEP
ncbi:EboA domain-containing protein [Streptomyces collinus]|uniref:EboA domain-containing protein n=1 Tax=Streptomyces collinus TaxID=42684 RepID=UPI003407EE2E